MKIILRDRHVESIEVHVAADLIRREAQYVHWYDALPSGSINELTLLDLAYPAYLDAVPRFRALLADNGWDNLNASLRAASAILCRVPMNVPLSEWPDTQLNRGLLVELFRATTGGANGGLPHFGPARCTKMLHKKRPNLIPIIDSWQLQAWGKPTETRRTGDMVDVVFSIRNAIAPQADEFAELALRLKDTDSLLPDLSVVRLYDILFWELSKRIETGGQLGRTIAKGKSEVYS
jgi:hypothetical protein